MSKPPKNLKPRTRSNERVMRRRPDHWRRSLLPTTEGPDPEVAWAAGRRWAWESVLCGAQIEAGWWFQLKNIGQWDENHPK